MPNLKVLNADGTTNYIQKIGSGTSVGDPFVDPRLPTDAFGTLRTGMQVNHSEVQFYRDVPSTLMTITSANGGTATQSLGGASFASSTAASGAVRGVAFSPTFYRGGAEIFIYFTAAFTTGIANSSQRYGLFSLDLAEGVFIGYEGTSFGVSYRNNSSDTTIAQASFNGDLLSAGATSSFTRNGTAEALDPTKLNVYRIRLAWVGGGPIIFEVLSPDGIFVPFHTVKVPNSGTAVSIRTADLYPVIDIVKTAAAATNLVIYSGCYAAGSTAQQNDVLIDGAAAQTALNNNVAIEVAGTNAFDCLLYRSASLQIVPTGTISTGAITFEGSNNNVTWQPITLNDEENESIRTSSYTIATGVARSFSGAINYRFFKARISTGVTGGGSVQCFAVFRTESYSPKPIGSGATTYRVLGTLPGNAKASPGSVLSVSCTNLNAATRYLQIFNSTGAPSGTPLESYPVYGNGGVLILDSAYFGASGLPLSTGITFGFSTTALTYTAGTGTDCILVSRYS